MQETYENIEANCLKTIREIFLLRFLYQTPSENNQTADKHCFNAFALRPGLSDITFINFCEENDKPLYLQLSI